MQQQRLSEITSAFAGKRIVVCGDFFLIAICGLTPVAPKSRSKQA